MCIRDRLHDAANAGELQSFLAGRGIDAGPPRSIAPSLEDVFVQLVTRPRDGAKEAA